MSAAKSWTLLDHPRRVVGIGIVYAAVFGIGLHVPSLSPSGRHWWADMGWTVAALGGAVLCASTARRCSLPLRRAWQLFALGCAVWFAGMLVWDYLELVRREVTPFPALSDVGFLLHAPLFALGLLYYRAERPTATLTLQGLSDFGLILCATMICAVLILLRPLTAPGATLLYKATALGYPALYISAALFSLMVALRHVWGPARRVTVLITLSLGVHAYTCTLYAYSLLVHDYEAGEYLDVFWVIAFGLIAWAAAEQAACLDKDGSGRTSAPGPSGTHTRPQDLEAVLPVATLVLMGLVVLTFRNNLHQQTVMLASPFAALYLGFMAAREWATHRIQRRLFQEARRSAQQLRVSEQELSTILESMQDTYFRIGRDGKVMRVSASVYELLGYHPKDLTGHGIDSLYVEPQQHRRFVHSLSVLGGRIQNLEAALRHRDSSTVWVSTNAQYVRDAGGRVVGVEGTARNVTDQKRAEAERHKLASAVEQTADSVTITNREGVIEYVNPAFEAVTGYSSAEAVGSTPAIVKSGRHDPQFYHKLWETILTGEVYNEVFVNQRKDGSFYYEAKTITPIKDEHGRITHFVSTGKDITEQMQTQEKLQYLAHHDALTGLPNRMLFLDRVEQALARAHWHERLVALMFLDLDRFKTINDSLGHDFGDRLLALIGERLHQSVRDGDTVARFGGDEFVVLLDDIASETDIAQLAERVLELLAPPFNIDGRELYMTASIGISFYPNDGADSKTLMRHADIAMYRAKDLGRNTFKFFSDEMSARAFEYLTLENSLRHALEREEFELYYQTQVDVTSRRIVGVEALLRWRHPERGLVQPSDFVPLLEETGMIVPVGEWVLRTACRQLAQWQRQGATGLRMGVNLSARQFNEPRLGRNIERIVAECGVDARYLELEMTESVFMRHAPATTQTLGALHDLGVRLAIDDFGTGYSSLNYLKRFSIDTLKIDRSFVGDIITDADDAALTAAIIAMARSLSLEVVAEGVESEAQAAFLHAHGCHCMQGFYFGEAAPAAETAERLTVGGVEPVDLSAGRLERN
ncbi:MAG: EAL domain-containing protein [Gammaproteobacteria bacterium]